MTPNIKEHPAYGTEQFEFLLTNPSFRALYDLPPLAVGAALSDVTKHPAFGTPHLNGLLSANAFRVVHGLAPLPEVTATPVIAPVPTIETPVGVVGPNAAGAAPNVFTLALVAAVVWFASRGAQ